MHQATVRRVILTVLGLLTAIPSAGLATEKAQPAPLTAKWIWAPRDGYTQYNDTIVARKKVMLTYTGSATMRITADSYYRLYINDQWVADGPCRSWPSHYQYDELEVGHYLSESNASGGHPQLPPAGVHLSGHGARPLRLQ